MISPAFTPEEISDVIYEMATDKKDQQRYFAGKSAKEIYDRKMETGAESSRLEIKKLLFDGVNA